MLRIAEAVRHRHRHRRRRRRRIGRLPLPTNEWRRRRRHRGSGSGSGIRITEGRMEGSAFAFWVGRAWCMAWARRLLSLFRSTGVRACARKASERASACMRCTSHCTISVRLGTLLLYHCTYLVCTDMKTSGSRSKQASKKAKVFATCLFLTFCTYHEQDVLSNTSPSKSRPPCLPFLHSLPIYLLCIHNYRPTPQRYR